MITAQTDLDPGVTLAKGNHRADPRFMVWATDSTSSWEGVQSHRAEAVKEFVALFLNCCNILM